MAHARPALCLLGALLALAGATGCGGGAGGTEHASPSVPSAGTTSSGPTAPASAGSAADAPPSVTPAASEPASPSEGTASSRCHTSELRASVGRNDPGAGQEHFPVVLTNVSSRTCTVYGYPGAAFLDAAGGQLGPDPVREPGGTPAHVTLAPGGSAWAGLSFSNPGVSGADAATPVTLLVTPPDERDPLRVPWTGGEVPVSGDASAVRLSALGAGTGP